MSQILVWDASALHHAIMADRLDVLGDLASGLPTGRWRNVTTATVLSELDRNGLTADGSWLETCTSRHPKNSAQWSLGSVEWRPGNAISARPRCAPGLN